MAELLSAARDHLAFPLDYPTLESARRGAEQVRGEMGVLKVGLELFTAVGPEAVRLGEALGMAVFLDLKLHDIPATVESAVSSAAGLGVRYLTLHASGGPRMLEAAQEAAARAGTGLTLLAVTVLTSLDERDLGAVGVSRAPGAQALALAELALSAGIGGLVCSPAELAPLRERHGDAPALVTPGIRPAGAERGDQKRVGTPHEAILAGSSLLVVGRPVRQAPDPRAAAAALRAEVAEALSAREARS
ncbi:MAG: orotidine-5'-phosphate decarboxylase [Polyangiaceae bacterium]|nr:orotidine-5'-phosphate decarboxylase [Polyangiaceae bacterium]MCW5791088.1 orotidine-5'-phosphate decarboxylase [Polyangiaceae bacterium]